MKRAISLTVNSVENYVKRTIDDLSQNNTDGYTLFMGVEPNYWQHFGKLSGFGANLDFIDHEIRLNPQQYGVKDNPYKLLSYIFDEQGCESCIYLEDDLWLSNRVCDLANWYWGQPKEDNEFCLNLYNDCHKDGVYNPAIIHKGNKFAALGLCLTRNQWINHFKKYWYAGKGGWDTMLVKHHFSKHDVYSLYPEFSHTLHNPTSYGVHYKKDMNYFDNNTYYVGEKPNYYLT